MPPLYVTKNGQQHGPYTLRQLDELLQSETFTGDDLYWHQGATGWRPISQLPGYVAPPSSVSPPAAKPTIPLPKASSSNLPAPPVSKTFVDPIKAKETYVKRIRSTSTYPTFRSLVGVFVFLIYLLGIIWILGGLIAGVAAIFKDGGDGLFPGIGIIVGGVVVGTVYIIIGKFVKEASLMLVDIADTLLDHHSRYDQQK